MDNALKGILLAAAVVITCVVIGIAFYYAREAKNQSASASENLAGMSQQFDDPEKQVYDGATASGSEVIDCISKLSTDDTVVVRVMHKTATATNATAALNLATVSATDGVEIYGKSGSVKPANVMDNISGVATKTPLTEATAIVTDAVEYSTTTASTAATYIRPNGSFKGSVQRDDDNNIVMITFQQTK